MKKLFILIVGILSFSYANAGDFVYPFDNIATPKCRFSNWNELGNDCKMTIPRIEKGDYSKYKDNTNYRKIYSVLWGATYNYGWDIGFGSHLGVDIATSAGTPVRSIGDGEVVTAGRLSGRGNTVVIKHKLSDNKYIYSNYAHLSKIIATKGNISASTIIGEVGSTGNSYGNHLHFQIDITNQSHPYWYTTCSKGLDIMGLVNEGLCRDYLLDNTVDPIIFLESNGKFISNGSNVNIETIKQKQEETKKIEQKNIKSREQILDEEIDEFLKNHTFSYKTQVTGDNLKTNTTYITKFYVYENGKEFSGNLPGEGMKFTYDSNLVINPTNLIVVEKGGREIKISSKKSGKYKIEFKLGKKTIYTKEINFYSNGEFSNPTDASILTNTKKSIALGDEKMGAIVMKTKYGSNQIYIPYDGTYKLKVLSGKVKFCNISKKSKKICNPIELASELEFRYEDTKSGVMLFNFIAFDYTPIKFVLQKVGSKHDIAWTNYQISVTNPLQIDGSYVYYNEVIESLKKGYIRLNKGYLSQDRELVGSQIKEIVNNYFSYEYLKAGDNKNLKNQIIQKIKDSQTRLSLIDDFKRVSRGEYTRIIFENLGIDIEKNSEIKLLDEKGFYKDYITTLRKNYLFKWKDSFGENYFQPEKNITVGEALYLIYNIKTKNNTQIVKN